MTNILAGVCCGCGRIRSAEGIWVRLPVDRVLQAVTVARGGEQIEYRVSHGVCPECQIEALRDVLARTFVVPRAFETS